MTCRKFKRLWSACFPDDLPPAAHAHLSSCLACAAMAQADSATHAALRRPEGAQPIPSTDSARAAIRVSRRGFIAGLTGLFAGLMMRMKRSFGSETPGASSIALPPDAPVEYIVVGSGPGGGPLACNLAKAGHRPGLYPGAPVCGNLHTVFCQVDGTSSKPIWASGLRASSAGTPSVACLEEVLAFDDPMLGSAEGVSRG